MQYAESVERDRMGRQELRVLRDRRICRREFLKSTDRSPLGPHKYQSCEDPRCHRVAAESAQLSVTVGVLLFHRPLEHCGAARILVLEFCGEFLHIVKGFVFFERRGNGFDRFALFEELQFRLSVLIHEDLRRIVADRDPVKILLIRRHQLRLHGQRQPQFIRIARRGRHVLHGVLHALRLTGPSLCAELPAFLKEFLQELVAVQCVLPVLHGDQAVTHQEVFVALVLNDLLEFIPVHFSGGGIHVLSRASVFAAVCYIFCRLVEFGKILLTQLLIHFEEPVGVKASVVELFRRERRESGDHGFLAVVEPLVHMRHEVIAAALQSVDPQHFFGQIQPLRRVHGHLDQTVGADLVLPDCLLQICSGFPGTRPADLQQMRKTLLLARAAGI